MLYSMTGFGRSEMSEEGRRVSVEIRSVNHRYLDLNLKVPRKLSNYEANIRKLIQENCVRGKVDVSVTFQDTSEEAGNLELNIELAAAYLKHFETLEKELGIKNDACASTFARIPDVFTIRDEKNDDPALEAFLEKALMEALDAFRSAKASEGEALKTDLLKKLDVMLENVDQVEKRYPEIIKEYRERLEAKLAEVKADTSIDENRLAAELVIYSDKLCTDEETVRLKNHILTMKKTLTDGGQAGRRLDFIAQEMNREANTILSKANDLRTSELGIALKTDIEKVREQVQNVE